MKLVITWDNLTGGGEDRITLVDLLQSMGHSGTFTVSAIDDSEVDMNYSDDMLDGELIHEYTITVDRTKCAECGWYLETTIAHATNRCLLGYNAKHRDIYC